MEIFSHIALTFGLVLTAALMAGTLADLLHLPKVTGYLLIGVVLGPSGLDLLQDAHVHELEPFDQAGNWSRFIWLGMPFPDLPYEAYWETNPSTFDR